MHLHVCLFSSRSVKANGVLVYLSRLALSQTWPFSPAARLLYA